MDVDIVESTEEDEVNLVLDAADFSDGEGSHHSAENSKEDAKSRSMGADLQENPAIEQHLASGKEISEPEDSVLEVMQNPLENVGRSYENLVPEDETRGEELLGSESAHVIVDEEVDFDQFGAPPPDLPVIANLDNEPGGWIGKKGSFGSTEVQKPEAQVTGLDANNGFEHGALRNLSIERGEEGFTEREELQKRPEDLNLLIQEELKRKLEAERDERLESEAKLMVLDEILPNLEEKLRILSDHVQILEFQLLEQANTRNELENDLHQERKESTQYMTKLAELTRLHDDFAKKLHEEQDGRLKSEAGLMVLRELFSNTEDNMNNLRDQVGSLVVQLREETELRISLEGKLERESEERMLLLTKAEEQSKSHEDFPFKIEEERGERLRSETHLEELSQVMSDKEEKLKDLHNQVVLLTAQLQEQNDLKKELEGKCGHEREGIVQDAVTLPVSSMPWSEEKLEFEKLLDEQKSLLANQVQEAEKLKKAAEMKVGLLNHQVQNLEVLTDIAETMEYAFSAKEQVIKQSLWTALQALCVGVGLMSFVLAYRDPTLSSLQPT